MLARDLKKDLEAINERAFQWKISLNPDPHNQAHKVIDSRKSKNTPHPSLLSTNTKVS